MRPFLPVALVLLSSSLAAMAAGVTPKFNPVIGKITQEISSARIEATIRKLAGFGTRNSLSDAANETRGVGAARRWIKSELEQCSRDSGGRLKVGFDEHLIEKGPRIPKPTVIVNVVATLPGCLLYTSDAADE